MGEPKGLVSSKHQGSRVGDLPSKMPLHLVCQQPDKTKHLGRGSQRRGADSEMRAVGSRVEFPWELQGALPRVTSAPG